MVELTAWNDTLYDQMTQTLHQFQVQIGDYQRQQVFTTVPLSTRMVIGQAVGGILEVAEAEKASFIIIGTVGAASAWGKLIGSVASAIAQQANRPVWIVLHAVDLDSLRTFVYFADLEGDEVRCINQVMNLGERLHARLEVVHVSATGFIEKLFHTSQIRHLSLTAKRPLLIISRPG